MREPRIIETVIHLHDFDFVVNKVRVNVLNCIDMFNLLISLLPTLPIHHIMITQPLVFPTIGSVPRHIKTLLTALILLSDILHLGNTNNVRHVFANINISHSLLRSVHLRLTQQSAFKRCSPLFLWIVVLLLDPSVSSALSLRNQSIFHFKLIVVIFDIH